MQIIFKDDSLLSWQCWISSGDDSHGKESEDAINLNGRFDLV